MQTEIQTESLDTFDPLDIQVEEFEAGETHAAVAWTIIYTPKVVLVATVIATSDDDDDEEKDKIK